MASPRAPEYAHGATKWYSSSFWLETHASLVSGHELRRSETTPTHSGQSPTGGARARARGGASGGSAASAPASASADRREEGEGEGEEGGEDAGAGVEGEGGDVARATARGEDVNGRARAVGGGVDAGGTRAGARGAAGARGPGASPRAPRDASVEARLEVCDRERGEASFFGETVRKNPRITGTVGEVRRSFDTRFRFHES